MNEDHATNRAAWNELAALHGQDAYYDANALVAGRSSFIEEEEAALRAALGANVAGLRVLHVQCHLGFDAITFARRGAIVTGVDYSPVALARAASLADRCRVDIEWVCADVTVLPAQLTNRFDLAWATIGVLCWIADVRIWMHSIASTLAPEGQLILIDGYPSDGRERRGAASPSQRRLYDRGWDDATPARVGPQVQFTHSLPAIVAAASQAGLRVTQVQEHLELSDSLCIPKLERERDGRFRRRVNGQPQPLLFTLQAIRADSGSF